MPGPLNDIRVVDFTHALNGPFCTMLLGHLGAEVIKIEPPQGDNFRRSWMAPDARRDGYEFLWINVNKKSVALNLKSERGVELARELIARADVLVENYQKGTMERFGLDYDSVREINPRLVYACSRGYGEWGPYADYGNTAATNNSMTGWTHTAWEYAGAKGTKSLGIGDEAAGVSMTVGILAALHARERTGEGQKIVVSMQEAVLGFMVSSMHEHFTGNMVGNTPMEVADGYFTLRIPHYLDRRRLEPCWRRRWASPALATDPRFAGAQCRAAGEQGGAGSDWSGTGRVPARARRSGTPYAISATSAHRCYPRPRCWTTPTSRPADAFIERDHPTAGPTTLLAPWIHMSQTPASIRDDAPAIGQHTDEVLGGTAGTHRGGVGGSARGRGHPVSPIPLSSTCPFCVVRQAERTRSARLSPHVVAFSPPRRASS